MATQSMKICSSEKIGEYFPWPLAKVGSGESLDIAAKWIRFKSAWLTLRDPRTKVERNFVAQAVLSDTQENYVLLRAARVNRSARSHGYILAKVDENSVTLLTNDQLAVALDQFKNSLKSILAMPEADRQSSCIDDLERYVCKFTDWNLHEGPSFASFQVSTDYVVAGQVLTSADFALLHDWHQEAGDVFIQLQSVSTRLFEKFQLLWIDRAPSASFIGLRKPPDIDDGRGDCSISIYLFHETGTFEVADSREILQALTRLFDAAEYDQPLDCKQAPALLRSIAKEG